MDEKLKLQLTRRAEDVELLEKYSQYLEDHNYMGDTDWKFEEPTAINDFMQSKPVASYKVSFFTEEDAIKWWNQNCEIRIQALKQERDKRIAALPSTEGHDPKHALLREYGIRIEEVRQNFIPTKSENNER